MSRLRRRIRRPLNEATRLAGDGLVGQDDEMQYQMRNACDRQGRISGAFALAKLGHVRIAPMARTKA